MGTPTAPDLPRFATTVAHWQKLAGRHALPWQNTADPYRIWLSEIMLQQTQVSTVLTYYQRFIERFPTIQDLAAASQDDVMPYWAGLGYYARARNLHKCAQAICTQWNGRFPPRAEDIMQLPGIGRSTAAAIAAFSYGERAPILDGNVKRVFTRYFGIYGPTQSSGVERLLWSTAEDVMAAAPPELDMVAYTQGLMDLGSTICTRTKPACQACPLANGCHARQEAVQHELPTPRTKKKIDERTCQMLVLSKNDSILLQKRPSPGIWGGLWSLPQFDDVPSLRSACRHWGIELRPAHKMAGFVHVFSHFRLHIDPWKAETTRPTLAEPAPEHRWIPIATLGDTALPAPVRKILDGLYPAANAVPDDRC